MTRFASVQQIHIGLETIEGGIIRLVGGQFRAILEVDPSSAALDGDNDEALLASYAAALNGLRFPVQILVRVLPIDFEPQLRVLDERAGHELDEPLATLAREQAVFLRHLARQRSLLERRFYLVVPAPETSHSVARGWTFWRAPARPDAVAAQHQLAARCEEVARQLGRCGLATRRLGDTELVQLFYACWCAELSRRQRLSWELSAATTPVVRAGSSTEGRR
jgi:hypothetical protein